MDLTKDNKNYIDALSYEDLLRRWRFTESGSEWFQGETGKYWGKRKAELRDTVDHVAISKAIGWGER